MLNENIKRMRKSKGLSQEELAIKLNVVRQTVSKWENGNYMPPVEMLEELSNMYNMTINELLSGRKLTTEDIKKWQKRILKKHLKKVHLP